MAQHGHTFRRGATPRHLKEHWLDFWDRMERSCANLGVGLGLDEDEDASADTSNLTRRQLIEKLAKVEERLEVLERIVTDKGYEIADKIDRL